ncbi:alpha-L-rhamnosidase [Bifidobacterium saguinibicoloris]|uniref:alpha-L-rhamnosidase n=1 Tax=Bifidobacterium saguinibicoloris TaxID=2834433 RepID=UPI001C590CAD|nr:alpha-L-rhamnosidase [Bifidobacterium saguinibicoloris]MBW3080756.1 family 78 glycoside hydrolase catalytic domain [Bifidobacterium saguinibicoloris]
MTQQRTTTRGRLPGIRRVTVEHHAGDVLGIGTGAPRISWTYDEDVPLPDGAEAIIRATRAMPGEKPVVEETRVPAGDNILHAWPFTEAKTHEQVTVTVIPMSEDADETGPGTAAGDAVGTGASVRFEPGILHHWQWRGAMVGPAWPEPWTDGRHAPLVRGDVRIERKPVAARMYVSAYGLFEPWVNGERVGDDVLAPGWVDYDDRLPYLTYDVTPYLRQGDNAFGFRLADGWYRGRYGYAGGVVDYYGDRLGVYAQIDVMYADGSLHQIVSNAYDGTWKARKGPIVRSGLYEGERFDARLDDPHWCDPSAPADDSWTPVTELPLDQLKLTALEQNPIRLVGRHRPVDIRKRDDGTFIVDFGVNCSQRIRLSIPKAEPGTVITIRHAEVLDEHGGLALRPLRREDIQTDEYVSAGPAAQWEPTFTMHGFRYAAISGWPADELSPDDLTACAYTTDMERRGWFSCSDEDLDRLHDNIVRSMRSNFLSFPMDCPQRDERLGWTGDIAMFSPTALRLAAAGDFLSDWLGNLDGEIARYGTVPPFIPFITIPDWRKADAIAIWGDSAVLVPWAVYQEEGDALRLARHYPAARAWMDDVASRLDPDGVWRREPDQVCGQFGDWLDPTAPPDHPEQAMTEKPLVATAFAMHSAELVARMAGILGHDDDAATYASLADRIRAGFAEAFTRADGAMASDTECAYTLAIVFGLRRDDPAWTSQAGERLARLVEQGGHHVGTGFAGTPYLLRALAQSGHRDTAFRVLTCRTCPSWLYQVTMGATTTWERWDSIRPDGSINPGGMTSFNHYWLGVVAEWMHDELGGLKPLEPGWDAFAVDPHPGGGVTEAHVAHEGPHGRIDLRWRLREGRLHVSFNVPTGSKALVNAGGRNDWVGPGRYDITV